MKKSNDDDIAFIVQNVIVVFACYFCGVVPFTFTLNNAWNLSVFKLAS